ncbi:MAG: hypothetical protein HY231_13015 [Acidobacteria bacterium]|nr:hypothetical protein [Acidobacteriota bacterium]
MPSLQARTPMHGFRPLLLVSRALSFSLITFLLCAGWVGVCYLKSSRDNRSNVSNFKSTANASATTPNPVSMNVNQLAAAPAEAEKPEAKLVFFCSADKEQYHLAKHLTAHCARTALSESAAVERGLKPCPLCFPK